MSAFLYALHRELFCLNVDDYEVQNGRQLKQIASECCGVSLIQSLSIISCRNAIKKHQILFPLLRRCTELSLCFKTESIRKLRNINFKWTKALYQNDLKHIAFFSHFSRAKDVISHL